MSIFLELLHKHSSSFKLLQEFTVFLNDLILFPKEYKLEFLSKNDNFLDFFIYEKNLKKKIFKLNNEIYKINSTIKENDDILMKLKNLVDQTNFLSSLEVISSLEFLEELEFLIDHFNGVKGLDSDKLNKLQSNLFNLKNLSVFFNLFGSSKNSLNIFKILHEELIFYFINLNKIIFLFNFINDLSNTSEIKFNESLFNLMFDDLNDHCSILNLDNNNLDIQSCIISDFFDINNIR